MKVMALDASTKVASVALMENQTLVQEASLQVGLTHSETLMGLAEQALEGANWKAGDVDGFVAVVGPGSFTGLRIGVAAVKGLAQAAGKPVVEVGTLETLAAGLPGFAGDVVALLDARRGQVYAGVYRWENAALQEVRAPEALPLEDLLPQLGQGSLALVGDGVAVHEARLREVLGERAFFTPPHTRMQRAAAAAYLGLQRLEAGQGHPAADLLPRYYRESSALTTAERQRAKEAKRHG